MPRRSTKTAVGKSPARKSRKAAPGANHVGVKYAKVPKRIEHGLSESEEAFRLVFENANDAIFWADPATGDIINCNRKAEELLEKAKDEIIGKHQTDIHPPDKAEFFAGMFKKHLRENGAVSEEAEVVTASRAVKPVEINSSITSVGDRQIIQGIFRDITERKRMENDLRAARNDMERNIVTRTHELQVANEALIESERRFQQVAESTGEWIWEVDAKGLYTYSNDVVEEILGYKPEEVVGKMCFYDFFVPEEREELKRAAFGVFERRERFKGFVNVNVHKDGMRVYLETSASPIVDKDGNLAGYRGADTNITERMETEEALRCALKMKSEFMAMMSHELRTPLTRIITSAHLILQDPNVVLPEKRRKNLHNVLASSDALFLMINNVLEMARLEGGVVPLSPQDCDLSQVVGTCIGSCEGMVGGKNIKFVTKIDDEAASVCTDKEKLGHILTNLICNGIRYSDGGTIEVSAKLSDKEGCMDIAVSDEGVGIPQERIPELFEPFRQLEEISRKRPGGIGLGLSIVMTNLKLIGGSIDVRSKLGNGSTFTITIPKKLSK